jgi:hypothetical protein
LCWWYLWCLHPASEAWVLLLVMLLVYPHTRWGEFALLCLPESAGPVVKQVRASVSVSVIMAGVAGACGSGCGDVSMHVRVVLGVGRVAVCARGLVRACVGGWELGLCSCGVCVRRVGSGLMAGVVGARGSGFRDVSQQGRVMLRVGRVAVCVRGLVRACVRGGELGLCSCVAYACS